MTEKGKHRGTTIIDLTELVEWLVSPAAPSPCENPLEPPTLRYPGGELSSGVPKFNAANREYVKWRNREPSAEDLDATAGEYPLVAQGDYMSHDLIHYNELPVDDGWESEVERRRRLES